MFRRFFTLRLVKLRIQSQYYSKVFFWKAVSVEKKAIDWKRWDTDRLANVSKAKLILLGFLTSGFPKEFFEKLCQKDLFSSMPNFALKANLHVYFQQLFQSFLNFENFIGT